MTLKIPSSRFRRIRISYKHIYVKFKPFIICEFACGNLKERQAVLSLIRALPSAIIAEHEEVMELIEKRSLMGKGLGYIDMHLLASAILTGVPLWTLDKKLREVYLKPGLMR
ncbi:MAG: PIN domain-containing protein [Proteobacteria bacterium]|nr:PIN domain-containing protein [Pseudomonadota bacterium]